MVSPGKRARTVFTSSLHEQREQEEPKEGNCNKNSGMDNCFELLFFTLDPFCYARVWLVILKVILPWFDIGCIHDQGMG